MTISSPFPELPDWDKWLPSIAEGVYPEKVRIEVSGEVAEFLDMFRNAQRGRMTRQEVLIMFLRERTRYTPPHTLLLFRWLARVSSQLAAHLPEEERRQFILRVRPALENLCTFLQNEGHLQETGEKRTC